MKNYRREQENFVKENYQFFNDGRSLYILKGAYSKNFMEKLKVNTFNYFHDKPSEFYKMIEGCPDFHRKIDIETEKYALRLCKHSFYFYPWNKRPYWYF